MPSESEKLEAGWLEKIEPLSEAVSRVNEACNDSKGRIATILSEVQALQKLAAPSAGAMTQHRAQDLDSLKQDIGRLTDSSDSMTGIAEMVKRGLEGLQAEVKALSRMHAALHDSVEQYNLPQVLAELDTLQQQVARWQGSASSTAQSRGTQPAVQKELSAHILEELRSLTEQSQHVGQVATDVLSKVNELGPEQHADRLHGLRQNLLEVEVLRREVTAASNRSPDLLALQDTMVAPITQALERLMELSLKCQEKVNSIMDQVDGSPQQGKTEAES